MDEQQEHPEQDRILCGLAGVASDMYNGVGGVPDWCERLGVIAERIAAHGWRQQDEILRLRRALAGVRRNRARVPLQPSLGAKSINDPRVPENAGNGGES